MTRKYAPDEDAEIAPDVSDADRLWILNEIDPDWRDHFPCPTLAYEFYWQFEYAEMEKLERECDQDNRAAADLEWSLKDELADIATPFTGRSA